MRVGSQVKLVCKVEEPHRHNAAVIERSEREAAERIWDVVVASKNYAIALYRIDDDHHDYTVLITNTGVRGWVPPRQATRLRHVSPEQWCAHLLSRLESGEVTVHGTCPTIVLWSSDAVLAKPAE